MGELFVLPAVEALVVVGEAVDSVALFVDFDECAFALWDTDLVGGWCSHKASVGDEALILLWHVFAVCGSIFRLCMGARITVG